MNASAISNTSATPNLSLEGQVVHWRPKSKRLVFFDLRFSAKDLPDLALSQLLNESYDPESETLKLSIICKATEVAEITERARYELRVGDTVRIDGWLEASAPPLLHCERLTIVEKWSLNGKRLPFIPEAPLDKKALDNASGAVDLNEDTSTMPSVRHQTESCPDVYEMAKLACKYFTNTGHCSAGNACRFKHYTGDGLKAVRVCWIQQRQENRRTQHISSDPTDPHHKSSATLRAAIFVQWLVETYGTSYLSSGTGVLDIGGGRGIISFELSCKSSIPSTLIDPRNDHDREEGVRPNKAQRQWLKQQSKNGVKPDNLLQPSHIRTTFDSEFITRNKDLVERSSIFIGMHADQATEPIVDQALACGKPFAVLPCCVFPRENPGRRLKDGREVLTYEEFVQFLEEKDERIKKAFLPFEGRNLVLYAEATEKI